MSSGNICTFEALGIYIIAVYMIYYNMLDIYSTSTYISISQLPSLTLQQRPSGEPSAQ